MNINNPTFQLPRDWTAEQAEFLSAILEDLTQAIWETYEGALLRLWRDRDGLFLPADNQLDLQLNQPTIPLSGPEPLSDDDEEIPW